MESFSRDSKESPAVKHHRHVVIETAHYLTSQVISFPVQNIAYGTQVLIR